MTLVPVIAQSWILNFVHEAGLSVLSCILITDSASLEGRCQPFPRLWNMCKCQDWAVGDMWMDGG